MQMNSRRGQAYVETAVFLPLFMLLLFGILWLIQITVLNERGQIAVRYSGLVSNESSPYYAYSLYAIYNNVGTLSQSAPTTCATPLVDAYVNSPANGAFPGPSAAPFWQPDNNALASASCSTARQQVTGGSLSTPVLLVNTLSSATVNKTAPAYIQAAIGGSATPLGATLNFFNTPDIASMMQCYPDLKSPINASLVGEQSSSESQGATLPLAASNPTTPLGLTSC